MTRCCAPEGQWVQTGTGVQLNGLPATGLKMLIKIETKACVGRIVKLNFYESWGQFLLPSVKKFMRISARVDHSLSLFLSSVSLSFLALSILLAKPGY